MCTNLAIERGPHIVEFTCNFWVTTSHVPCAFCEFCSHLFSGGEVATQLATGRASPRNNGGWDEIARGSHSWDFTPYIHHHPPLVSCEKFDFLTSQLDIFRWKGWFLEQKRTRPGKTNITMENHNFWWLNQLFLWPFSSSQTVSLPETQWFDVTFFIWKSKGNPESKHKTDSEPFHCYFWWVIQVP